MAEHGQQVYVGLLEVVMQKLLEIRQTGILTVQRSKAGVREIGTITFLNGEPVEAYAGERLGDDAIQWLYTWGRCQCDFLPQTPADIVISSPPSLPDVETPLSPLTFLSRLRIGRNQEANEFSPANQSDNLDSLSRSDRADRFNESRREQPSFISDIAHIQSQSIPETPMPPSFQPRPAQPPFRTTASDSNIIFSEWLQNGNQPLQQAPQRIWQGQDALTFLERTRASRLHRHVFLLLDGQRNLPDLARITGHSPEEIKRLLNDLERLGMITQGHEAQAQY